MILNKIYNYFDLKYSPFVRYLAAQPLKEFEEFLECLSNEQGIMRDFHGFEFEEPGYVEFSDFSSEQEKTVKIKLTDLADLLTPISEEFTALFPEKEEKIKSLLQKIN